MRLLLPGALLMWLVLPACADADRDLPRDYRRLEIPVERLASADARSRGRELFLQYCALCHGERGNGLGVRREGMSTRPRDFTSREWRQNTSPRHVYFAIREGLVRTDMPGWKALSEQDGWDMTAYVLSLGERP